MRKFLFVLVSILFINLFVLPLANPVHAGILPNGSPCITSPFGSLCSSGFCKSLTQALPGLPGVCKAVAQCACADPGRTNLYTCRLSGKVVNVTCENTKDNFVCYKDSTHKGSRDDVFGGAGLEGVKCGAPNPFIVDQMKLPNPPPAPCAKTENGQCLSVKTSLGLIDTDPSKFIGKAFRILMGAAGGIALILLMRAGYQIMTARGNPEGLQKGREQLIAAIVGLLFLIFSFLLLQVIGIDILQIPGFGESTPALKNVIKDPTESDIEEEAGKAAGRASKAGKGAGSDDQPQSSPNDTRDEGQKVNPDCACTARGICAAEGGKITSGQSCSTGQIYCCLPTE